MCWQQVAPKLRPATHLYVFLMLALHLPNRNLTKIRIIMRS